jgi:hypothetical protein
MSPLGERHDGDGRTARAIRHIRGAGLSASLAVRGPGSLKMDSYRALDGHLLTVEDAYIDIYLTSAQVKALTTPIILVPAPGVGYFLEFVQAWLMLDYGGTNVFTETADNLEIGYGPVVAIIASQAIECTGFIDQAADTYTNALPKINNIATPVQLDNLGLYLHNPNDEFAGNAGGDNILRVRTHARAHQILA